MQVVPVRRAQLSLLPSDERAGEANGAGARSRLRSPRGPHPRPAEKSKRGILASGRLARSGAASAASARARSARRSRPGSSRQPVARTVHGVSMVPSLPATSRPMGIVSDRKPAATRLRVSEWKPDLRPATQLRAVIADLRQDRDHWREQAQRLALPAPKPAAETPETPPEASRLRRAWRWMRATG
jgi:hypothetical protein